MIEFIKQYQVKINSKDAREAGFDKTKDSTGELLNDFFKDIVEVVMTPGDETYLIQWAISKLDKGEEDAVIEGQE